MILTREYLAKVGGWAALKEATALQQAGKVLEATLDESELSGRLQLATGVLSTRIKLSPRLSEVENFCPCRQARQQGIICSHVLALGLEAMARQDQPQPQRPAAAPSRQAAAPSSTAKPIAAAPPVRSQLVPWSEAPAGHALLTPSFLLPLDLPAAWRAGRLRVILEAALPGGPALPWDAVWKNGPAAIADGALDALHLIGERHQGNIPAIVQLEAADFDRFFLSLICYAHLSLGKKSALAVARASGKPQVRVTTLPDGKMRVESISTSDEKGEFLPSRQGQWRFDGGTLSFRSVQGPILQRLGQQPMVLPPGEVPHFLQLPSLSEQVEVILCPLSERIEWRESLPRLHAVLDGSLTSLTCRLEAHYDDKVLSLGGPAFAPPAPDAPARWLLAGPRLYLGRDVRAEARARAALDQAGFLPMPRHPELHHLAGEGEVIGFLANTLPEWRRQWEIGMTPRLAALIGQCEIVAPRVEIGAGGGDWLSLETRFQSGDGSIVLGAGEVQQLLQTGRSHKRLPSGKIALIPAQAIGAWQEVLTDCDPEAGLGASRIAGRFAPYLEQVLRESGIPSNAQAWKAPGSLDRAKAVLALPAGLDAVLRPYQKEGVAWIHSLAEGGFCGILADEMGLGKTLQVLAYLAARQAAGLRKSPAIVIAPTSLLVNWQREAARFTPGLRTLVIHGAERHGVWETLGEYDLLVTSYALLRRDLEKYLPVEFDLVALDEAQHIKNRFSQNAQAVKALAARAPRRLILTGTPLENSLLDLWSMFDFLMPGYLGPAKSFRERYEVPITKQGDGPAMKRLRQRVHPFLLRRTKSDVAKEIPDKIESITYCDLTAEQREVYRAVLEQGRREVFEHSGKQGNAGKRTMAMLTTLTRLRQACCHLDLLPLERETPWKEPSAKVDSLFELIEEASDGGHRLLVFSQFVKLLKLIALRLETESVRYCYLDGSTKDRQAEIDRFQNSAEIPVFLISLKAGGTGLNLTAADTVIHCDPWWNPAVEDQATARAHRIGQQRIVTSYKLIARDTVEEKIVQLQERKKDLIAQTLLGEEALLSKLTQEEWEGLLAG